MQFLLSDNHIIIWIILWLIFFSFIAYLCNKYLYIINIYSCINKLYLEPQMMIAFGPDGWWLKLILLLVDAILYLCQTQIEVCYHLIYLACNFNFVFQAKFCASLFWLVFHATEDGGLEDVPSTVTSPIQRLDKVYGNFNFLLINWWYMSTL